MITLLSERSALRLYTPEQVRQQDRLAMKHLGLNAFDLMKRAGTGLLDLVTDSWPAADSLSVYCGKGNNAGDGYILSGLAARAGYRVEVLRAETATLSETAEQARDWCLSSGVPERLATTGTPTGGLVVDALLGTGSRGEPRAPYDKLIEAIGRSGRPVLSVDLPSGLDARTGQPAAQTVKADATLTFVGVKRGLVTGRARDYVGRLYFDDLQVPPEACLTTENEGIPWLRYDQMKGLPSRLRSAHKGHFGRGLLIGGASGQGGAMVMAAEAALRSGLGLLATATANPAHVSAVLSRRPEVMARICPNAETLKPLLGWADWIACGPGLGTDEWGLAMLQAVMASPKPSVLDADALNLLAAHSFRTAEGKTLILTPHSGEAARLLDATIETVEADRFAAAEALASRYGALVVLKGTGSILASPQGIIGVCGHGNPGMATGGMGDVLTGVILALAAQTQDAASALQLAVCLHALAADRLAEKEGEHGLLASDLPDQLRALLNEK